MIEVILTMPMQVKSNVMLDLVYFLKMFQERHVLAKLELHLPLLKVVHGNSVNNPTLFCHVIHYVPKINRVFYSILVTD